MVDRSGNKRTRRFDASTLVRAVAVVAGTATVGLATADEQLSTAQVGWLVLGAVLATAGASRSNKSGPVKKTAQGCHLAICARPFG
ncbi:hypothetical protein AB0C15_01615 [Micromonospora sp. NPDC048835]|uniref:hypothetical protein n=1 Tax=Micromonospora sp. NPDC048835 TaxID=3155147 RepID=UPI0034072947